MTRKRQRNRSTGIPGMELPDTGVQRLLQSAFRPAGASNELREKLIKASLNILEEFLGGGSKPASLKETPRLSRNSNLLSPSTGEEFKRQETEIRHVNPLKRDRLSEADSGAVSEDTSEEEQFRARATRKRFR